MSDRWRSHDEPAYAPIGAAGWLRAILRGVPLVLMLLGGLLLLALLRLFERPLFGPRRPLTPHITQVVCRGALAILGIGRRAIGVPAQHGIVVANHASWLDIFALNAGQRVFFVSKSDVRSWPGIGWLARATGTVFIDRDRRGASRQAALLRERLSCGHLLLVFPEGTSTDGRRVLPFRSTLFAALFGAGMERMQVQPVTLAYHAPEGEGPRFYGWWGEMDLAPHLLRILAASRPGCVDVVYHPPLCVTPDLDRKALAALSKSVIEQELRRKLNLNR